MKLLDTLVPMSDYIPVERFPKFKSPKVAALLLNSFSKKLFDGSYIRCLINVAIDYSNL